MTNEHNTKTTISLADLGWLLNRTQGNVRTDQGSRFSRLDDLYRRALRAVSAGDSRGNIVALQEAQARNTADVLRPTQYIEFAQPTHYAVIVENSYAEPVTISVNKATALEVARVFNLSQEMHPDGQALTAVVYSYFDGMKGFPVV